ncbi:hypothetical protein MPSEU_001063900 [Mayamaea pseudoterrestris]|nr:hypothetical protein MPSEU_001063900 [Mayamaea pseudoterrestris]
MAALGAFARTRAVLAIKREHPMAMAKWWAKKKPGLDAEITMHLSPYEQKIIAPWLRTFPKKVMQRYPYYLWPLSMVVTVVIVQELGDAADHAEDFQHRF